MEGQDIKFIFFVHLNDGTLPIEYVILIVSYPKTPK